jgi:hypothetical protein
MKLKQGTYTSHSYKLIGNRLFIDEMIHHKIANDQENTEFIRSTILGIMGDFSKDTTKPLEYNSKRYNIDRKVFENKRWIFDGNDRRDVTIHSNLLTYDVIMAEALAGSINTASDTVYMNSPMRSVRPDATQ